MAEASDKSKKSSAVEDFQRALEKLEQAVTAADWPEVSETMVSILAKLEATTWTLGPHFQHGRPETETQATRLATQLTRITVDDEYRIPASVFYLLCRFKRTISQVFEVSGYRGTGHLLDMVGEPLEEGGRRVRAFDVPKLLAMLSINALNDQCLRLMMRLEKPQSLSLMLAFLSEQMLYTRKAEAMRTQLLAKADHWLDVMPNLPQLRALGPAYMGCSYAVAPDKHDIKRALNAVTRRWLDSEGVVDSDLPEHRPLKDRPKLLIFAEFYHSTHAMHRCYGASIRGLKDRFETVLMLPKDGQDSAIEDMVDRVIPFEFDADKGPDLIKTIQAEQPDILYMPSVGMRLSSVMLSVMRLAPIQVMTFGHPATTKSPHMDYVILAEDQISDPKTIQETVVLRPKSKRHSAHSDAKPITPDIRLKPDTIKIAVPAWSRKVVPAFFEACNQITRHSKRPVEFVFFPNAIGALHHALVRRITTLVPNSVVLPRKDYNRYIEDLNGCDLFLSSFPFGATNGILDASQQGLPIINLKGPEVHTFNDSHLVSRLDQPEWLSVDTVDAYVAAVVRLVNDDALRVQISRNIIDGDPKEAFMVDETESPRDFVEIFEGLYHFHEQIQASGRHVIHHRDMVQGLARRASRLSAAQ